MQTIKNAFKAHFFACRNGLELCVSAPSASDLIKEFMEQSVKQSELLSRATPQDIYALLAFYEQMGVRDYCSAQARDWREPSVKISELLENLAVPAIQQPTLQASEKTALQESDRTTLQASEKTTRQALQSPASQASQQPAVQAEAQTRPYQAGGFESAILNPNTQSALKARALSGQKSLQESVLAAQSAADQAQDLAQLEAAVQAFEGCTLKAMSKHTVFADGAKTAQVMVIGDAPGSDEDRSGKPFVGASGQLLDDMLRYIGLDRAHNLYISSVLYWRPPGNRTPSQDELAICAPFLAKQIALVRPQLLLLFGGTAAQALLGAQESITKLRGQWQLYHDGRHDVKIPAMPLLHPAYMLRQPLSKRYAWQDCLSIKAKAAQLGLNLSLPSPSETDEG